MTVAAVVAVVSQGNRLDRPVSGCVGRVGGEAEAYQREGKWPAFGGKLVTMGGKRKSFSALLRNLPSTLVSSHLKNHLCLGSQYWSVYLLDGV